MNADHDQEEERERRYTLFIMHAQGKRIVPWNCPNCGDMPHVKETKDGNTTCTCMQCGCVSGRVS